MRNSTAARGITILAACALAWAALVDAGSARAGSVTVTTLNDSGPGSLRQAVADAKAGDTITFGVQGTITLASGALTIDKDLAVEGPGPREAQDQWQRRQPGLRRREGHRDPRRDNDRRGAGQR